jgi:hypothetical protein
MVYGVRGVRINLLRRIERRVGDNKSIKVDRGKGWRWFDGN